MTATHLTEEQWIEALLETPPPRLAEHLAACEACRSERARLRGALGALAAQVRSQAARPEAFWSWQHEVIAARIQEAIQPHPARGRLVWASATATVVLAAMLLLITLSSPRAIHTAESDPDHLLLVELEASLRRPVPRVLEPALLLTREMDRAAEEYAKQRN